MALPRCKACGHPVVVHSGPFGRCTALAGWGRLCECHLKKKG